MKKKVVSLLLAATMVFTALAMSGCGGNDSADDTFGWWLYTTDGGGTYYEGYEDNPAVQWLAQQSWDVENHTLSEDGKGKTFQLKFQAPITGSEQDNFNNLIATGDYPEIFDMAVAGSKESLIEDGILADITEYVEKYMPDYVALLDEHPDWKSQVTYTDENGETKYYWLALLKDGPPESWDCMSYRRDWVVQYAEPTEYVWDWDSDYVKENGHPAVTPLAEAQKAGNLEGWKKNDLYGTKFTSSEGEKPSDDYTDNVIFPSGTDEPLTISDWEWMLEAFDKAIEERGWADDGESYGFSVAYGGFFGLGDLVSSFGGGTGGYYVDKDGKVSYSATSDNFKAYLECVHHWYEEGWLDQKFETRASDMFFSINEAGCTQGKVGMWLGTIGTLGDVIRVSCQNETDKEKAFVMGCALPLNDMYGTDAQKFTEPDALYQAAAGPDGGIGISDKAMDKSEDALEALFTYFNWCYTEEGAMFSTFGLTEEQYKSVELENDLYAEYGYTDGLYHVEDRDGVKTIVIHIDQSTGINFNVFRTTRMVQRYEMMGQGDVDYQIDWGYEKVKQDAIDAYGRYTNTGSILPYMGKFTDAENDTYNKINNPLTDYINIEVPKLVKNGTGNWDAFVEGVNSFDPQTACELYQKYVDEARAAK